MLTFFFPFLWHPHATVIEDFQLCSQGFFQLLKLLVSTWAYLSFCTLFQTQLPIFCKGEEEGDWDTPDCIQVLLLVLLLGLNPSQQHPACSTITPASQTHSLFNWRMFYCLSLKAVGPMFLQESIVVDRIKKLRSCFQKSTSKYCLVIYRWMLP